jgi:pimeloyl-ACP methyl ester carboxylesterase
MKIRVNGVSLYFDVEGPGLVAHGDTMRQRPTVVALHGGPGIDHSWLKPMLAPLARVAQIVYLDHRGNGRSERGSPETWNLATWADDVRAFCDALGIERPVVLGTSFGGFVAQAYATRHPNHPGKLVLAGTSPRFHAERAFAQFGRLGGPDAAAIARRYFTDPSGDIFQKYMEVCLPLYRRVPPPPTENPGAPILNLEVARHFIGGEWHTFDFRSSLRAIACPTLILAGEEDPVLPIVGAEEMAAGIAPRLVRFERFAGVGHEVLSESPRALALVEEFLQS